MTASQAYRLGDLLVRRQPHDGGAVLYVHGATFPSALSAAYRFDGRSWLDDWNAHGFDAWAFDFKGYGGSDRYPEMSARAEGEPVGRADEAAAQIAQIVEHVIAVTGRPRLSIVAHSWGTIPAALYATRHKQRVEKLCLFGPVAQRDGSAAPVRERWRLVTVAQQLSRFVADVPRGHAPVLIEPALEAWGPAYLATDPEAAHRDPPAVKLPSGPAADVADAWSGHLPYRPEDLHMPTLVVRGEWDSVSNDDDARWLLSRVAHARRRDAKIAEGTHLMHLEHGREGLFHAVRDFLGERA